MFSKIDLPPNTKIVTSDSYNYTFNLQGSILGILILSIITELLIDKSQVIALADRLALLLGELKAADYRFENVIAVPLEVPLIPEFQIGVIGLIWIPDTEQIALDLQEINEVDFDLIPDEESGPALFKLFISPDIANNFVTLARKVVAAGRMPCPFCGLPINKDGHLCPRANGYRR